MWKDLFLKKLNKTFIKIPLTLVSDFDGNAESSAAWSTIFVQLGIPQVRPGIVIVQGIVSTVVGAVAKTRHVALGLATVAPDLPTRPPARRVPINQRS